VGLILWCAWTVEHWAAFLRFRCVLIVIIFRVLILKFRVKCGILVNILRKCGTLKKTKKIKEKNLNFAMENTNFHWWLHSFAQQFLHYLWYSYTLTCVFMYYQHLLTKKQWFLTCSTFVSRMSSWCQRTK